MSHKRRTALSAALVLAIAALTLGLLLTFNRAGGSAHHPVGDSDKASDCWAKPDSHGRRHCAR